MSLELPFSIKIINPKPVDSKYLNDLVPYTSVAQANTLVPQPIRYVGLTVNINGAEYWYENGVTNSDLVLKTTFDNSAFTAYTASTEVRLQQIETDVVDVTDNFNSYSASTDATITEILSDVVTISGITATKQDQLSAGDGISAAQFASEKIALDLSNYIAPASINLQITGATADFVIRDNSVGKRGVEYGGNYHSFYSLRSLVDKQYVDNVAAGLSPKNSVNLATTEADGNIDLTGGTFGGDLDGTDLIDLDRILVKNQTDKSENGIYIFNLTGNTFTRATDFDDDIEVTSGTFTTVISGATLSSTAWILTTPNPIVVDTTDIEWSVFALPTAGVNSIQNVGSGVGILSGITDSIADLRSLVAGSGVDIYLSPNEDGIIIEASGSTLYSGSSPAAIDLGGIDIGYVLTGKTVSQIIEDLLVPTLYPTLTAPLNTFSKTVPSGTIFEVGSSQNITFSATFSRGSISPQYSPTASPFRSGLPNRYNYTGTGLTSTVTSTSLTNGQSIVGHIITLGSNAWTSSVRYSVGVQPYDSKGGVFSTPLASGTTGAQTVTLTGIYPYFYGKVASGGSGPGVNRPSATNSLVTGGTKVVSTSTGTITVNFNSTSDDYIWFAIPSSSTSKTKWYVDALNNGTIGGIVSAGGNLFPNLDTVSVTTVLWAGVNYKVYISNYQTEVTVNMELRNS